MQKCSTGKNPHCKVLQTVIMHVIIVSSMLCLQFAAYSKTVQQVLDREVSLELKDVTLKKALREIESAAKVKFVYSSNQLNLDDRVSLTASGKKLSDVLNDLLTPLKIEYSIQKPEDFILLLPQKEKSSHVDNNDQAHSVLFISGTVTDARTKEPLPGVNVLIKNTTVGTTTDAEGYYTIEVQREETLIFSFIGYSSKEVLINDQTRIDIELAEDATTLKEVEIVSTGYEELLRERTTGSFSKVDNELFNRQVSTDAISRLKGIAPSIFFDQRSGENKLAIRGRSTIFANDQPLIVVDNFPYEGDINNINPNDIESISILKDAAAASIWGVRAGNGVIVITTKRGSRQQAMQVEINSNVTIGNKPDLFYQPRMSTSDFIDVEQFLFDKGYFDAKIANTSTRPPLSPVTEILAQKRSGQLSGEDADAMIDALRQYDVRNDLEKYFYRKKLNQQYSLSLRGGSNVNTYYLSAGFDKNLSEAMGNEYNRIVVNANHNYSPVKNLEINTALNFTQSKTEINNTLSDIRMTMAQNIYPYARLANDEGNALSIVKDYRSSFIEEAKNQGFLDWSYKPLNELKYTDNKTDLSNTRLSAGIKYTFIEGLSGEVRYQYERQARNQRHLNSVDTYFTRDLINKYTTVSGQTLTRNIPLGGILFLNTGNLYSHNGRGQLNYNKAFSIHHISALAGFEVREIKTDGYSARQYGFDDELGRALPVDYKTLYKTYPSGNSQTIPGNYGMSGTTDRYRSYFANAAYTFDERYSLSISGRIDQSNLFGVNANQRSVPLWSTGLKLNIDRESFYSVAWLPVLKLRATYGYNGNVDNTVTALTTGYFGIDFFNNLTTIGINTPPNSQLRWEKSGIFNIGTDFAVRNNVLSGSIEYYQRKGVDIMGRTPLDPTTGIISYKGNVANIKGHGWDVELNTRNIDKAFKWQTTLLFSQAIDKVTRYKQKPTSINGFFIDRSLTRSASSYTPYEGKPLFGIYSYRWAGLDPATGDPLGYLNGLPSNDYTAMASIVNTPVDSLVYHGPALPPVFGAIRNAFSYKSWSFSFNVTYRFGYYFRRNTISYSDLFANYITHSDYEKRWQEPGDEASTNVPSLLYPANSNRDLFYMRSEVLVEKGDNIRLQDVTLSYTIGKADFKKLPVRQVQLYTYLNNIKLLWKANHAGIDPDFPSQKLPMSIAFGLRSTL